MKEKIKQKKEKEKNTQKTKHISLEMQRKHKTHDKVTMSTHLSKPRRVWLRNNMRVLRIVLGSVRGGVRT